MRWQGRCGDVHEEAGEEEEDGHPNDTDEQRGDEAACNDLRRRHHDCAIRGVHAVGVRGELTLPQQRRVGCRGGSICDGLHLTHEHLTHRQLLRRHRLPRCEHAPRGIGRLLFKCRGTCATHICDGGVGACRLCT